MPALAFNIYPKGFGNQVQPQDAYGVGRTIVEQYRVRIRLFPEFQYLTGQEEGFSILLYPEEPNEVKLQVRFCEEALSNLGANTPIGGGL